MQAKYYKIGEFSKITGVSIKSLRYYDEIGVLKPIYVDRETNYRYYMPEQIIELNVIKLCLSLNLPLKSLKWKENGDINNLIDIGKDKAQEVIRETYKMLDLIDDLKLQIDRLNEIHKIGEVYTYNMPKRQILIAPWKLTNNSDDYIEVIAKLNTNAKNYGLTVLTQQGLMYSIKDNKYYVYMVVKGNYQGDDLLTYEENVYRCMILNEDDVQKVPRLVKEKIGETKYIFYLNTDIYDFCLRHPLHMLEVQCI